MGYGVKNDAIAVVSNGPVDAVHHEAPRGRIADGAGDDATRIGQDGLRVSHRVETAQQDDIEEGHGGIKGDAATGHLKHAKLPGTEPGNLLKESARS